MDHLAISTADREEAPAGPPHPIVVILDRLRSAHNVGNIYRLAELTRIERVVTCGYTATPPHPKLLKTARGCESMVPTTHFDTSHEAVLALSAQGYHVTAVETMPAAPALWDATWPSPVAFLFGNEALGIEQNALAACDSHLRLPVYGRKNSLNVGNCAAVVLYEAVQRLHS